MVMHITLGSFLIISYDVWYYGIVGEEVSVKLDGGLF